jgi:hypothetical protein
VQEAVGDSSEGSYEAQTTDESAACRLAVPRSDACLIWRINSSYEPMSAAEGQAAISLPTADGSATATFADKLAALPIVNSAHGKTPRALPQPR